MTDTPRPVVLDVSRTLSRVGLGGETGIDRVEAAYLHEVLSRCEAPLFLARIVRGVAVLDRDGMEVFLAARDTDGFPAPDLIGHLSRSLPPLRRRAESLIRRHAVDWSLRSRADDLLNRVLPAGADYLNIGHSNLVTGLGLMAGRGRNVVLVHDVIPLDFPEFARPGTPERFEARMRAVSAQADVVICNSAHTAERTAHWLERFGRVSRIEAIPLGVAEVGPVPPPDGGPPSFVVLGTIEPRKNHALLLEIWSRFENTLPEAAVPRLHLVGRRGWSNAPVFQRLDSAGYMGRHVVEHGFLPDEDVRALMVSARAVLFPSLAEGFGYPLVEALQLGRPVIASDLPAFRELAPEGPDYLDPRDVDAWARRIMDLADAPLAEGQRQTFSGWAEHFERFWKVLES